MADIIIQYYREANQYVTFCYVQVGNTPQTGLTDVRLNAFEWDSGTETRGTQIITNQIMTEVDGVNYPGWYYYDWLSFTYDVDYVQDFDVASLSANAKDIEYLNIKEMTGTGSEDGKLYMDEEFCEMYSFLANAGNIKIIKKI